MDRGAERSRRSRFGSPYAPMYGVSDAYLWLAQLILVSGDIERLGSFPNAGTLGYILREALRPDPWLMIDGGETLNTCQILIIPQGI